MPVVADSVPDFAGPLAGILAGLDWAAANAPQIEWLVSVPGDCPFLPKDLVARLHEARVAAGDAARLRAFRRMAPSGRRRCGRLRCARICGARLVDEDLHKIEIWTARHGIAIADWPAEPIDPFFNVNTPEDAARAEALAAQYPDACYQPTQRRVGEKADRRAGLDRGHVLAAVRPSRRFPSAR